ncbi:hydrophobe/amphiphile efflux-1 family RND transporter [Phenylobacterium hankyongense]|uniref:Efflux pump membrane transporter n=1 Tax=Phenylobacterium hankyongense TaxID=1813876 RepID=A0A328B0C3_9CAUL|nr:efflux RND transporter permease subunit [Phenylobacterium hankyongense]RAK60830.1 hydrophobe/amphiphile efflux-1 family RND transporter [Phenylobacterium hankyongense]
MSRFFIDRPIFAWVIALVIMLAGALAVRTLPIAQYPDIAPPAVTINATYPGASAETLQNSVTQVIEQQLKGLDGLIYFSSNSSSSGQVTITATFKAGTNPDIAQVQVQNKVQAATPLLPQQVQQLGVTVAKTRTNFLLIVALSDPTDRYTNFDIADFIVSNLQDPLSRVDGVGAIQTFGAQHAMRIWLDPFKLTNLKLNPGDVQAAIQAQNTQVSAGQIGGLPAPPGQQLNATVTAQSRLKTADDFRKVIVRSAASGGLVTVGDVARVELGSENYDAISRLNGHPAAGVAVQLAPGANALTTADAVKARAQELASTFPPGVKLSFPVDNTTFVRISIHEVIKTLAEAMVLVVIVMFVFLQNWRATLIPTIAVPVVLLGTFGVLAAFGYSINTLTLFAVVLVIGLLVDDAIVVVENVERLMAEEGLSPKAAARKSMDEITGALTGIALVLSAVLVPMGFFGGSTGVIYRQFSVTMVSAIVLSVLVALVLTPALCATLLRPHKPDATPHQGLFGGFNRAFDAGRDRYERGLGSVIGRPRAALVVYGVIVAAMVLLFVRMPTGFLPEEDQGAMFTQVTLPVGASQTRTLEALRAVEHHFLVDEKDNVGDLFTVAGFNFAGAGQNSGIGFIKLKDWDVRKGAANRAPAVAQRAMQKLSSVRDAQIFAVVPPAVQELGNSTGFDLQLENRGNLSHQDFLAARNQLLGMAAQDPTLVAVRPNGHDDTPQLHVDVDTARAGALGLNQADINSTLSAAWGATYVNDFIDRDRVKRVYMQGDAPFRSKPDDLFSWNVRNNAGTMTPFSSFANIGWTYGPAQLQRYNGLPSFEIQGQAAPGKSSGAAMTAMEKMVARLPPGVGLEWTGLSLQERASGAQAPMLYGLSILVVFLCLAALYESWSIPVAVLLILPLGVVGALLAASLRGLYNDIYFQVGLLTTMGLAAKNAILIVEFAVDARKRGVDMVEAAIHAARLRLRPILMTSLAFMVGVFPLAISTGAGAGSQNDIGTGVIGGMLSATIMALVFTPLFFVLVLRYAPRKRGEVEPPAGGPAVEGAQP